MRSDKNTTGVTSGPPTTAHARRAAIFALAFVVLLLTPAAQAGRDTTDDTMGVRYGYRMVDDQETDGPTYGDYWALRNIIQSDTLHPGHEEATFDLAFPYAGPGCAATTVRVSIANQRVYVPGCDAVMTFGGNSDRGHVEVVDGQDGRMLPTNVIRFYTDTVAVTVLLSPDGTVEAHVDSMEEDRLYWYSLFGGLTWHIGDASSGRAARFDPYAPLETEPGPLPIDDPIVAVIPGQTIVVGPLGVDAPDLLPDGVGPVTVPSVPIGVPAVDVERTCVAAVLCVGPIQRDGEHIAETPPLGPFEADPVDGPDVPVPVALEVTTSDIVITAATHSPQFGTFHGITVVVPVPGVGDVPVTICDACPVPVLTGYTVEGSVTVRATVAGETVETTVPVQVP